MADLTPKQLAWANAYLETFNKTEAARRAGYEGNDVTLASVGYENFRKPQIEEYLRDRLNEKVMSADEALALLSEQARGSLGEFAEVQVLADLEDHPKARLVKSLTSDVYEDKAGKVHYKARIELYDSQSAIVNVLKVHGKFKETTTNLNLDLSQLTNEQLQRIAAGEDASTVLASTTQSGG